MVLFILYFFNESSLYIFTVLNFMTEHMANVQIHVLIGFW